MAPNFLELMTLEGRKAGNEVLCDQVYRRALWEIQVTGKFVYLLHVGFLGTALVFQFCGTKFKI